MLKNKSNGKTIMQNVKIADSFWKRFKGLMFEKRSRFDYALVFPFQFCSKSDASIHMFFVFFPIDVVFLDEKKKVVDIVKGLKPFVPLYVPKKASKYLIELPEGKAAGIKESDALEW